MTIEEVWNMLTCCVGANEGKSYEIGSSQPCIEEERAWRRKLCALRVDKEVHGDEVESIAKAMLG